MRKSKKSSDSDQEQQEHQEHQEHHTEGHSASIHDRAAPASFTSQEKKDGVLYLGIDLGTSRTSVAASNGARETVASYVGYPKDVISRKLLKTDVLFGDDAIKNRLALKFYRPLEHGVIKSNQNGEYDEHLKAAKDLIGEIIRRAQPRKDELVYAVIGAPAQASINNNPRPESRSRFDFERGSGVLSGSNPLPSSQIRASSVLSFASSSTLTFNSGSCLFPCSMALITASRTASPTFRVSSSSNPTNSAIFSEA